MISVSCPSCQKKLQVKDELAGKRVRCLHCKQAVEIPAVDAQRNGQVGGEKAHESLEAAARYEVEGEIARGGMGAIMRAVDQDIRREVAVKFLLNQADDKQKARFVEEAQITGQLEHPNIVPIHQLGVHQDGRCFFSMKMVRGRSLGKILKEPRPDDTLGRQLTIFVSICNPLRRHRPRALPAVCLANGV